MPAPNDQAAPTTMDQLNDRAATLSRARNHLGAIVQALNAGLEALKAERMSDIRAAIDYATEAWSCLEKDIQDNPHLFIKPRKVAAHGIVFGIEQSKATLQIADPKRTVALIRKHLPDQADVLIAVEEAPVKKAVEKLPAADLKRIGVAVVPGVDTVVIRPATSDVDKLVKAFVKSNLEEKAGAAAEAAS